MFPKSTQATKKPHMATTMKLLIYGLLSLQGSSGFHATILPSSFFRPAPKSPRSNGAGANHDGSSVVGSSQTRSTPRFVLKQTNIVNGASVMEETCFTSDVQHLRIEDTDAYGIMYNANYLKAYARSLESRFGDKEKSIIGFRSMKFSGSPLLGEAFVVRGTQNESDSTWDMTLESYNEAGEVGTKEYNYVQGLLFADVPLQVNDENDHHVPFEHNSSTQCLHENQYTIYKDEFEHGNRLPLFTVLNYFERPRSQSLGGAKGLFHLQEIGIMAVVTRIDNLRAYDAPIAPGDVVKIQSYALLRRKSLVSYTQVAFVNGKKIAEGTITVMTIDENTKRPAPLPEWALREVFCHPDE